MEVKEVFSCFVCGFVFSRGMPAPAKERMARMKIAPIPLLI
jgi:rubredoxin